MLRLMDDEQDEMLIIGVKIHNPWMVFSNYIHSSSVLESTSNSLPITDISSSFSWFF